MTEKIMIGNKAVGEGEPTFIIAEVGSNHNQNLEQAKKLIEIAAECQVDAVKFQLFKTDILYSKSDQLYDLFKKSELPHEWVKELKEYSEKRGLIFLASPFDKESIDLLDSLGIQAFKWASSETTNLSLLKYAADKKKPLIISTGMCNLADIYEALEVAKSCGNKDIALLQCTSLYPTKAAGVNLRAMDTLKNAFHLPVGYSDHTLSITASIAAVARGACIIEKHFTVDRKMEGLDHYYALEPSELKAMVEAIRETKECLGSPLKEMLPEERVLARRESIFAKNDLQKNTILKEDDLIIRRPAAGIETRFLKVVMEQKLKSNLKKGDPLTWNGLRS